MRIYRKLERQTCDNCSLQAEYQVYQSDGTGYGIYCDECVKDMQNEDAQEYEGNSKDTWIKI